MQEPKTVYENEQIVVTETGRDYDFVATIVNKSDNKIKINFLDKYADLEPIELDKSDLGNIKAHDWCGLFNDQWFPTEVCPDICYAFAFRDEYCGIPAIEIEEV